MICNINKRNQSVQDTTLISPSRIPQPEMFDFVPAFSKFAVKVVASSEVFNN